MISITLFLTAAFVACVSILFVVYAKSGEQETLAGIIGAMAFIVAAIGALFQVAGY